MAARQVIRRAGTVLGAGYLSTTPEDNPVVAQPIQPVHAEFEPGILDQTAQLIFAPACEVDYPDSVCLPTVRRNVQRMSIELSRNAAIQRAVHDAFFRNGGQAMLRNGDIDPRQVADLASHIAEAQYSDAEVTYTQACCRALKHNFIYSFICSFIKIKN
jgi:hypothetical protein